MIEFYSGEIVNCDEYGDFLRLIDNEFTIPLSKRVDINEYSKKLLEYGTVLVVKDDSKIIGTIAGYAKKLMNKFEKECEKLGMSYVSLHTNKANQPAIFLYKGLGFESEENKAQGKEDDIYFVKKI